MSQNAVFLKQYRKILGSLHVATMRKEDLLREYGWKWSSDYPGSFWLWSKTFTESDVQWIWKGDEKVPHPGFTINGASTETALGIEAAWQDLWTRNDKQNNDEGQNKC
jgi:hypothetical protein